MSQFKTGDKVRLIAPNGGFEKGAHIGMEGAVSYIRPSDGQLYAACLDFGYIQRGIKSGYTAPDEYWELIKVKETTMSKFYRVLKDTPVWEAGAILTKNSDGDYEAISDLWNTDATDKHKDIIIELDTIVENSPEWFERVYEVKVLGKAKYLAKEAAKEAHNKLVKK